MLRNSYVPFVLVVHACAVAAACGSDARPIRLPSEPVSGPSTGAPGEGTQSAGAQGNAEGGAAATGGTNGSETTDVAALAPGAPNDRGASGAEGGEAAGAGEGAAAEEGVGGAAPGAAGGGLPVFPEGARPRLMIVGDSISAGPGCYKGYLLAALRENDYSSFDFVGEYTDDCGAGVMHSAVSCSTAEQYTQPSFTLPNCFEGRTFPGLSALVATHQPDLLMLQLGVNDVWNGRPVDAILNDYGRLAEQARTQNPNIVLVFAQIQKIRPDCSADDSITRRAQSLVEAVPAWAQSLSTESSPVFVADLWTNSDWSMAETLDCVHPNDAGAQRMGLNWFDALRNILNPG